MEKEFEKRNWTTYTEGDFVSVFSGKTCCGKSEEMLAEVVGVGSNQGVAWVEVEIIEKCEAPKVYGVGDVIRVRLDALTKL